MQVLTALDSNNGNRYVTAKQFGVPRETVSDWYQRRATIFEQGERMLQERRLRLAQRMELIVNQIVNSMPGKVKQARLSDSAHALRILLDLSAAVEAKQAAKQEHSTAAREKLIRLLERYASSDADAEDETPDRT